MELTMRQKTTRGRELSFPDFKAKEKKSANQQKFNKVVR